MQLGVDALHREVRALDEPDLDAGAARGDPRRRELDQALQRGQRVRQVRLQHDARLEPGELGLGEQRREDLDGQVEVAVLLHVEVDERGGALASAARYSGRSRSSTRATVPAVSHVEICETSEETLIET